MAEARAALPFLAVWDDHDYGVNDGGASFAQKAGSAGLFHEFWQMKQEPRDGGGIYYSRIYGPPGRRVQVIMLDTRTFRSDLKPKAADFPHWGKYSPDDDPAKTMLGQAQWAWLAAEIRRPAELRILVSSVQVLAEGHGNERWGNLPRERDRLLKLIEDTNAKGVILLSGDRHSGAFYKRTEGRSYPLVELTSSSLNRPLGPLQDTRTRSSSAISITRRISVSSASIGRAHRCVCPCTAWPARKLRLCRCRSVSSASPLERPLHNVGVSFGGSSRKVEQRGASVTWKRWRSPCIQPAASTAIRRRLKAKLLSCSSRALAESEK